MGFDTETRPTWRKRQIQNPCALLQIAVRDAQKKEEVFILDLLNLPTTVYNGTLTSVFLSKKIIKIGHSFYQDLQNLVQSYPHASCFTVCKGVVEVNDLSISLVGAHNPLSLQKLVFFYLHRKLAKTQQVSNWERRPLSFGQLHYAAADALVLLHLYDELLLRIRKQCTTMTESFRLRDVTNVLDVNLPPDISKCSLCFETFQTRDALMQHRKICLMDVRMLAICVVCNGKKLETEIGMEYHVKHCSVDEVANETIVQVRRKRLLSVVSSNNSAKSLKLVSVQPKANKRRETKQADATFTATKKIVDAQSLVRVNGEKKKRKKARKIRERTHKAQTVAVVDAQKAAEHGTACQTTKISSCQNQERKKRTTSMESSLLASDAMWSKISSDYNFLTSAT
ncbi:unnamed protein product [Peronospora belbahrii]|uniref:3'-5' exonuclease domain-containing protein n=1 Tax=Peronospora belbahrii TaxID=622444 RepID=A0AAU9LDA4_9STRA|nr:unnamed protein product [Peronospora belbahrii]